MTKINEMIVSGSMGMIGAIAQYFYKNVKNELQFKSKLFMINCFLGFFIGMMVSSFFPEALPARDGFIFLSGFLVYQVLDMMERKGLKNLPFRK